MTRRLPWLSAATSVIGSDAYRPDTLKSYRLTFRRAASALVRGGVVPLEQITGFHVLFEGDNFRESLRPYVKEEEEKEDADNGFAHKMAIQLIKIARDHLRFDVDRLEQLAKIAERIRPTDVGGMGKRNRTRLAQFDDADVVRRLLRFPEEERARALRQGNPLRRAKGIERALAVSILTFTGIRVKNLRHLRTDTSFRRVGNRVVLKLTAAETKDIA